MPSTPEQGRSRSFWPESRLYRALMAALAPLVAIVGLVANLQGVWPFSKSEPEVRGQNYEVLLDRSAGMGESFGAATKLAAAIDSVGKYVGPLDDSYLGLREFGGACDEDSKLAVGLGIGNSNRVVNELREHAPTPAGESNLARAVIEAADDFSDQKRYPESVEKRIVVVTGVSDTCELDPVVTIRNRLPKGIKLSFRFIGLGIPPAQRERLRGIASEFSDGATYFVDNERELTDALHTVLELEPLEASVKSLVDIHNNVIARFNDFAGAVSAREFDDAEDRLAEAEQEFEKSDISFRGLEALTAQRDLRRIYELESTARKEQGAVLDLGGKIVEAAREANSGDSEAVDAYDDVVAEAQKHLEAHNRATEEINRILAQLKS